MTKSIKEKTRLAKIKEHKANNTPITSDLLKVTLSFSKISEYKKFYHQNIQHTLLKKNWVKNKLYDTLKKDINERILNIAQHLEIYDLTVRVVISINEQGKVSSNTNESQAIVIMLLEDKYKNSLGTITVNERNTNSIVSKVIFDNKSAIPSTVFNPIIESFENECNMKPYKLIVHHNNSKYYLSKYKDLKFAHIINNVNELKSSYLKYLDIKDNLSVKYVINDTVEGIFYSMNNVFNMVRRAISNKNKIENKSHLYKDVSSYNKISLIETLIALEILKIEIPEELFNMENIEEIENSIRLNNY